MTINNNHYQHIINAIRLIEEQRQHPSNLDINNHHLESLLSQWAGISLEQFNQYTSKEYAKKQLEHYSKVDESKQLNNPLLHWEEYDNTVEKNDASTLSIHFGTSQTPFGLCFIACSSNGIFQAEFYDQSNDLRQLEFHLHKLYPSASFQKNNAYIEELSHTLFQTSEATATAENINILVQGTAFQKKVWKALTALPKGSLASYQNIAQAIQQPTASRAVASAIAKNNIAYLIPCHRVIRSTGELSQYRWGKERKAAMIAWEASNI